MGKLGRINPLLEVLRTSPHRIQKLMVQRDIQKSRVEEIIGLARKQRIPILFVPKKHLDRQDRNHQGIVAFITRKEFSSLEDILEVSEDPFVILLDGIEDPQNLGAIIRTAACAGVDGVILPERRSAGLTDVVASVSSGGLEHIQIVQVTNLARTMDVLKEKNFWLVGADAEGEAGWYSFDYSGSLGIVFGSEGHGIRPLVLKKCDTVLSLPILGGVTSLNVSAAAAVFMYEVVRQRIIKNPSF